MNANAPLRQKSMSLEICEERNVSNLSFHSQHNKTCKIVRRIAKAILYVSGISLMSIIIFMTLPKIESTQYEMGICNVTKTMLNMNPTKRLHCRCSQPSSDAKCVIYYPCLQIFASFKLDNAAEIEAMVVHDRRQVDEECSYKLHRSICYTTNSVYREVEAFREKWGQIQSPYKCFYKSANPTRIILTNKAPSLTLTVNLTIFPAVGIMFGLLLTYFKTQISSFIIYKTSYGCNDECVSLSTNADLESI